MTEKSKTAIDQAFEELDEIFGANRIVRREQIQNLREVANNPEMKISPFDKAMVIQSKLMIVKTLDDLMKSDEEVSIKKLKMKLARQDSATNGMVGQTIVAMLKSIRASGDLPEKPGQEINRDAAMAELLAKQEANKEELKISDGELETCGSSPTTDGSVDATIAEVAKKQSDGEDDE